MLRRVAVLAAGLAMMASLGLTGPGPALAASPASHIKPGAIWTFETRGSQFLPYEQDVFSANGTFTEKCGLAGGDAGTWFAHKRSISMQWMAGTDIGQHFNGKYISSKGKYVGTVINQEIDQKGLLLHKAGRC